MAVTHSKSTAGFSANGTFGGNFAGGVVGSVSSSTFTYIALATGSLVLVWTAIVPASTSPTTCSLAATGWTFSQLGGIINGGVSGGCGAMFWAYAPNTSSASITVTWNQPTTAWFSDLIDEFSGVDSVTPTAGNNSATGSGTPSVSLTPTANNCMIWAACNDSVTGVGTIGGSAATKGADDTQQDWATYRLLTGGSGVSQTCSPAGSGAYIIGAVAIKPASASAANWKKENYWWQRTTDSSGVF